MLFYVSFKAPGADGGLGNEAAHSIDCRPIRAGPDARRPRWLTAARRPFCLCKCDSPGLLTRSGEVEVVDRRARARRVLEGGTQGRRRPGDLILSV